MRKLIPYFLVLFFAFPFAVQAESPEIQVTDPLSVEGSLQPYELHASQGAVLLLKLKLPPHFHAYVDKFKVVILEPDGTHYSEFKINPVVQFFDKFSNKNRASVEGEAILTLPLEAPAQISENKNYFKIELTYQACSDSYCLFPKTKELTIPFSWKTPQVLQTSPTSQDSKAWSAFSGEGVKNALEKNLFLAFALVFLSGLLTSFTPCIFPMIPITLAILGHDSQKRSRLQNFSLSLFYVVGIATTYSILGVVAASSGQLFGSGLGHPLVIGTMCLIFFLMALSMYGVFELQVPASLRQSFQRHSSGVNFAGAYFSGIAAGVVASPCVGPVLVTLLAFVASTQNRVLGFFLLFTYAIGLGVIFLVLGAFTQLAQKLPRSGPWMEGMKFFLGSLMLGAFYYYLSFLLPPRWHDAALGLGLIVVASFFGAFMSVSQARKFQRVQKGLMQSLLALGIGFILVAVFQLRPLIFKQFDGPYEINSAPASNDWKPYSDELLAQAAKENRPVIIDFFADWCLACHELDEKTFARREVQEALADFTKMRFDATKESSIFTTLRKKYKIMGLPTVLFFNAKGEWLESATVTQFENPEEFLKTLKKLKSL